MSNRHMPLRLAALSTLVMALAMTNEPLSSQNRPAGRPSATTWIDGREAIDGEVIVRYRSEAGTIERERAEFQAAADAVEPIGRRGARRMRSDTLSTPELLQILRANPDVEFVEPNYIIRVGGIPDEPMFTSLWGLFNTGQTIGSSTGIVGADISAVEAWDITTGSQSTVVGIVDTGIDYNHPDLAANVWSAPHAFSVNLGGLVITCAPGSHGFNAINNTCNPLDDNSHGTHVAGTIGAVGNNGVGVAGVNWTASLMGLKFLNAAGSGTVADAIKAIEFAIQAKAALGPDANIRILNNSWGSGGISVALRNQVEATKAHDMLFVAAAGNNSFNNDIAPFYPASYASENVVSVAASTNRDEQASFSNYGASSVHLHAPGQNILSTVRNNQYQYFSGTSMAAPHVSGAAALMLAACPRTTEQLKTALLDSVDPVAALSGLTTTGGRLNADALLAACAIDPPTLTISVDADTITVTVENGPGNPGDWLGLYCPATNPNQSFTMRRYLNGLATPPETGLESATLTFPKPAQGGTCNARLFRDDSWIKLATSSTVSFPVVPPTVTVTNPNVGPGATLNIVVANGPGSPTDWIGLYRTGAPDSPSLTWTYLNGSQVPPVTPLTNATLALTVPTVGGTYEVRFYANDGYDKLATSNIVTVTPPPTLTINDVSVAEGHTGSSTATFTVTLSPAHASQTATVNYVTVNGSASAASDYIAKSGTLSFAPGVTTQTISVAVNGDALFESDETFSVALSNVVNAMFGDALGTATIVNDDIPPVPSVTALTPTVSPGGVIQFAVANGPANPTDWVGLYLAAAGDTAYLEWMYLNGTKVAPGTGLSSATLQFTAPMTPGTYNVRFFAQSGYTKLASSGNIANTPQPTLSVSDVTVTEGQSGSTVATFTVSVSPVNAAQTVTVNYATANGSALANSDYTPANGTLTFPPSSGSQIVAVTIHGDTTPEPNETLSLNLSGATNAVIGDASGTATITDDDTPTPTVTAPGTVGPGGTIQVVVANGPANPGDWIGLYAAGANDSAYLDWAYLNGTKAKPATGVTHATINLTAPTAPGTYNVRFFANSYTLLTTSAPIIVVSLPTLSISDILITEGHTGSTTATFTVTLNPPNTSQTVTVDYATANGSATIAGGDYIPATGTLTFAPSTTTRTIGVTVNGDTAAEGPETFVVNLSNAVNAVVGDAQGSATIVNDDGPQTPQILVPASAVAGGTIVVVIQNGPANRTDWIGLYQNGTVSDQAMIDWWYLSGTRVAPATGTASATLTLPAPTQPGTYQYRFFANNGFTRLAISAPVTVTP